MSTPKFDSDGFQIVSSKKSFKNKPTKIPRQLSDFNKQEVSIDFNKTYRQIGSVFEDLKESQYSKDVIQSVSTIVQDTKIVQVVCFGLGSIGECNISKHQLALLLRLINTFNPDISKVHDPIFTRQECDLLKRFNLKVIEKNNEGSYIIPQSGITLVYLPHCPKQLTNNFLWSNWSPNLENCILLCNSFTSLADNQLSRVLSETVPYIHRIIPYTTEVSLVNSYKFKDIFNDTAIHYFPKEKLELASSDFWTEKQKPKYKDTEEFITSLVIEKLNIV